ncbi:hypothetical protein [Lentzea pudingi]|nr:hypothetical protein [Lentzea pudingi]
MGAQRTLVVLDRGTASDRRIVQNALDRVRMRWAGDRVFVTSRIR